MVQWISLRSIPTNGVASIFTWHEPNQTFMGHGTDPAPRTIRELWIWKWHGSISLQWSSGYLWKWWSCCLDVSRILTCQLLTQEIERYTMLLVVQTANHCDLISSSLKVVRWTGETAEPMEIHTVIHTKFIFSMKVLEVASNKGHVILLHFFLHSLRVNAVIYIEILNMMVKPWIKGVEPIYFSFLQHSPYDPGVAS